VGEPTKAVTPIGQNGCLLEVGMPRVLSYRLSLVTTSPNATRNEQRQWLRCKNGETRDDTKPRGFTLVNFMGSSSMGTVPGLL
jgi:hypothetical protein